ncbi:MAG: FAD-dependent oxidoreductase [Pseudomonadota bacterium]
MQNIVIIGGGHAGAEACVALRANGFEGRVHLFSDEPHPPYHRPPLSKGYLKTAPTLQPLQPEAFYAEADIDLHLGVRVTDIDARAGRVFASDGSEHAFDGMIYAAGSSARRLPMPGGDSDNVHVVKTHDDGCRLAAALAAPGEVVVIGAGFIGLEVAASAAERGASVTVIDVAGQIMARTASAVVAATVQRHHEAAGIRFRLGCAIEGFVTDGARVTGVTLKDDTILGADHVVVGIGVTANDDLARAAGLATDDGVLVNAHLEASAPNVTAIGDCARFPSPFASVPLRLESVQNATDQARAAARTLLGYGVNYAEVPWFWSDQGTAKLQMAGIWSRDPHTIVRGTPEDGTLAAWHYVGERFAGVEAMNRAGDYMLGRRLLGGGVSPNPKHVADPDYDLKSYLRR